MLYTCQNNTCAIALSKQEFAKQLFDILNGKCPGCQQPLVELNEASLLSEEDEQLIASLPYVIAYPLKQTLLAKDPFKRINLFKDTFLNYLKYLGLLSASEFFNSNIKDRGMVSLFHQNLTETAFGKWNHYIRETLKFLKEKNHQFFCPELVSYYEQVESGKKVTQYKGEIEYLDANGDILVKKQEATAIGMLINFRNKHLGHGTMPDDEKSIQLWNEYFPIFRSLLEQMRFSNNYPMLKREEGQTWLLQSSDIVATENKSITDDNIWMQNAAGNYLSILPFFIVPGELAIQSSEKAKLFTYESYTGKTIKFFSPEGIEKQTSGKILDRLNLLLRDKQKEIPFTPETFTKEIFLKRIEEENKLLLDTLISEKKIIPGVYQHRENMEIKLREWIGSRANIFFIAAEAGSGKTNLLAEIQKQYTERDYPGLLIRAGRMEKNTFKEQVAYLLNIDVNEGLDKYTAIAGTQAEPSFILIDGLNEANNAEAIWQEIMDWSKIIEPGSIKFVITSRANTKADLERYKTEETDLNFLYGENKDHEKGLGAHAFWLTPLDMNEMKGAWENYVAKDKSRYKPLFSFDDIATFDRAIYNHINNPLVLRLFLEIYNGKNLPKKGGKHLHIWKDWFHTFSPEEQTFLKLLADEVWLKGENELLLDDLLNNENIKPYLTSDLVNSPYARMKNMGWVSRYVKDINGCLGFTVEGALLYLLGVKLQQQEPAIDLKYIQTTLTSGTKLKQSAIESFLCEQALAGELDLVTELIDAGTEQMDLCIRPLLYFLKSCGVEATLKKVLENPTENDWKVLFELDFNMSALALHILRKVFFTELMLYNKFQSKESLWLGLKACSLSDKETADKYLSSIRNSIEFSQEDADILDEFGHIEEKIGKYDNALKFYQKSLEIKLKTYGGENSSIATSYENIGIIWDDKGEYDKALDFYQKCLDIRLKTHRGQHSDVAISYNNIGIVWDKKGEYDKALNFYEKSIGIDLITLGCMHPSVAVTYNNIGVVWRNKCEYNKALDFHEKSIEIILKTLGSEHYQVAYSYNNIGIVWSRKKEYDKALEFYHKSLDIKLKILSSEHSSVAASYENIGLIWKSKGEIDKCLEYLQKSIDIKLKTLGNEHPSIAVSYYNIGLVLEKKVDAINALDYFLKSSELSILNLGIENELTKKRVNKTRRLARLLGKEGDLPIWIKSS
jgi:tetratricopeptide (TPR) repeat protein